MDFAAEQAREFAADRKAKTGAAVFAAGAGVRLLECLEDQLLLLQGNADAGIGDLEGDHGRRGVEHRMIRAPTAECAGDLQPHFAFAGELEGVGEQVLQHLLQALGVGDDAACEVRIDVDLERQIAVLRLMPERPSDRLEQVGGEDFLGVDRHRAGLDLGEIENVADEVQEVGAGAVDGAGEFDLLAREVAVRIVGELLSQDQDRVQRRAQLVAHIGQEFRLVLRGQRELGCLFLERAAGLLDFLVLALDLDVTFGELLRLLLELVVGLLQFALLGLELAGKLLRLLEQAFGLHRRFDRIEHDADGVGELLQEGHLRGRERGERGELDHRLDLALEQHRQHHEVLRCDAEQRRVDRHHVGGNIGDHARAPVERALADQTVAERKHALIGIDAVAGIGGKQQELRIVLVLDLVDHAGMGVDQR